MPDKRYAKGCGKDCVRCWVNRLNHGSKLKKKRFPKAFMMDENDTVEKKEYETLMEQFHDLYIVNEYNDKNLNKIKKDDFDDFESYNNKLISDTTEAYNHWLWKEWGIKKKLKSKDLIKTINDACKLVGITSKTNMYYLDKDKDEIRYTKKSNEGYYLFSCNYFTINK